MSARTEDHAITNWPAGIEAERCFLVQSPNRVVYIHAEDADQAKEWVEKLEAARSKVCMDH